MNQLFPVFLKIEHLDILLVGGGYVGLEKLEALLANCPGAYITLVAKEILQPKIKDLAATHPNIHLVLKAVEVKDLQNRDILILATDDPGMHKRMKREAEKIHLLTNVADTPNLCDFYLSSIVQKGDLKIAISTNGMSPTLAKRLKETFYDILPDSSEFQVLLDQLVSIRNQLKDDFSYKVKKLNEITSSWHKKK